MNKNLLPIAKEGWKYVIVSVVLFFLFKLMNFEYLSFFAFVASAFFIYIFRNPEREQLFYEENSVVSPVDGMVTSIEETQSGAYAYKVEIESSYLNVSLLRAPFIGTLKYIKMSHGARISSKNQLSRVLNENVELVFADRNENELRISHRLKESLVGIEIKDIKSKTVLQGSRYGFMVSGVTTLYLPKNFRLSVNLGDELMASNSLIGFFTTQNLSSSLEPLEHSNKIEITLQDEPKV